MNEINLFIWTSRGQNTQTSTIHEYTYCLSSAIIIIIIIIVLCLPLHTHATRSLSSESHTHTRARVRNEPSHLQRIKIKRLLRFRLALRLASSPPQWFQLMESNSISSPRIRVCVHFFIFIRPTPTVFSLESRIRLCRCVVIPNMLDHFACHPLLSARKCLIWSRCTRRTTWNVRPLAIYSHIRFIYSASPSFFLRLFFVYGLFTFISFCVHRNRVCTHYSVSEV